MLLPLSIGDVSNLWDSRIAPASWAFSIWSLIYSLIVAFTIYQAIPDRCTPRRNNDLIFNKVSYWFSINLFCSALWSPFWCLNTIAGFIIALVVIIGMLFTAVMVLDKSLKSRLSVMSLITLRCGFSIYAGWLSVATILNVGFVMKSLGFSEA